MKLRTTFISSLVAAALMALSATSPAAPAHNVCEDLPEFGAGVSSYSSAEGWPEMAEENGASWQYLYLYVFPSQTPTDDMTSYIQLKGQNAKDLGAHLVLTFYDLLKRGQSAGFTARPGAVNGEADIVQQTMEDADAMRGYFDGFIAVVEAAESTGTDALVQVEPDSWGFMMWAMGTEGRTDASTLPTQVVASGHPDLVGQSFPDDAGGLGQALVYLRDKYAPGVRLGWHASNFRSGTRADVVTGFYSQMGDWDVIVSEEPHIVSNEQNWWEPLSPEAVDTNVGWVAEITEGTGLPMLFWQVLVGPFDFHLFEEDGGRDVLQRFFDAGLVGVMWEIQGSGATADDFRGIGLATPPSGSPAGGTAKDFRERLAAYQADPLPWPPLVCNSIPGGGAGEGSGEAGMPGSGTGGSAARGGSSGASNGGTTSTAGRASGGRSQGGATSTGGSGSGVGGTGGTNSMGGSSSGNAPGKGGASGAGHSGSTPTTADAEEDGGCGCFVPRGRSGNGYAVAALLALVAARLRRRSRQGRVPDGTASAHTDLAP